MLNSLLRSSTLFNLCPYLLVSKCFRFQFFFFVSFSTTVVSPHSLDIALFIFTVRKSNNSSKSTYYVVLTMHHNAHTYIYNGLAIALPTRFPFEIYRAHTISILIGIRSITIRWFKYHHYQKFKAWPKHNIYALHSNKINRSVQLFNATFSTIFSICSLIKFSKFLFTIYHNPVLIKSWSVCHYVSFIVLSFHLLRFIVLFSSLTGLLFLYLFSMHRCSVEFMRQHWHFDVLEFIWISAVSKIDSTIISEVLKYRIDWKLDKWWKKKQ